MKKITLCTIISAFTFIGSIFGQETMEKNSRFSLVPYAGIGYVTVDNDKEVNYNLNVNQGTILVNYSFSEKDTYGISTGVGFTEMTGNGFSTNGNFFHERTHLRIPLLLTLNYPISDKFEIFTNLGGYAQTILKDDYQFIGANIEDVYEGWNFGFQFGIGLLYDLGNSWSIGIQVDAQSDFTDFETNSNLALVNETEITPDEQKFKDLSTIGLIFRYRF